MQLKIKEIKMLTKKISNLSGLVFFSAAYEGDKVLNKYSSVAFAVIDNLNCSSIIPLRVFLTSIKLVFLICSLR